MLVDKREADEGGAKLSTGEDEDQWLAVRVMELDQHFENRYAGQQAPWAEHALAVTLLLLDHLRRRVAELERGLQACSEQPSLGQE